MDHWLQRGSVNHAIWEKQKKGAATPTQMSVTNVKYERSRGWIAVGEEREDWRGMKEWKIKEADGGKQKTEREKWEITQMETSRKENREGSRSSKTRRVWLLYKGHKATGRLELETYRFYRRRSAWGIERGSLTAEWGQAEEDEVIMGKRKTCRKPSQHRKAVNK